MSGVIGGGPAIGVDIEAHDSDLDAIAAVATQPYGRSLLALIDSTALAEEVAAGGGGGGGAVDSVNGQTGDVVLTKSDVGLSNVDNTADADKPVSSAQSTALALKAPLASPAFTGTPTGITKTHVGLGNVDNTSDVAKPISTLQQAALDLKAPLASPTFTGTVSGISKAMVGLGSVDNTADTGKPVSTAQAAAIALKADIASPTFTGTPLAPTPTAADNSTKLATTAFVQAAINALIGAAPGTLDTFNEIAAALGNDPNFAATITTSLAGKQPLDSDLTAIAALTTTTFGRALLELADAAAGRTALGLGTAATQASTAFQTADSDLTAIAALTTTTFGRSLLTQADAAATLATLGAQASGSYQPLDSDLTAIAALTTTSFGRSFLALADAAAALTLIGAQPLDADLTSIAALTTTSFGRSLLTQADAAAALATIGAQAAGSYQPLDSDLTAIAALATLTFGRSVLTTADAAALRTLAGLVIGTNVQAYNAEVLKRNVNFVIDGGGAAITTGIKGDIQIPFAGVISGWHILGDQSGSIVIDLWKDTEANFPPVVGDTITAAAKPTVTTAVKGASTTLTGWTTSVAAGDIIRYNVDSVTTLQRVTIVLDITI